MKLADYIRASTFKTLVGDVTFGAQGEWAEARVLQVQFQNVKGNDVGQFRDISTQVVITPAQDKSGQMTIRTKRPSRPNGPQGEVEVASRAAHQVSSGHKPENAEVLGTAAIPASFLRQLPSCRA